MASDELIEECAHLHHDAFDEHFRKLHSTASGKVEWADLQPVHQEVLRAAMKSVIDAVIEAIKGTKEAES